MIHTDISDNRYQWNQDIGCVQSAAEPGFKHTKIHSLLQIIDNCDTHVNFKHTEIPFHPAVIIPVGNIHKSILTDILIIYTDTIQVSNHIRRGKAAHLVASSLQNAADIVGCASFAVCSCNMYTFQLILRISQSCHVLLEVLQSIAAIFSLFNNANDGIRLLKFHSLSLQSIGVLPSSFKQVLIVENGLLPKKPLEAERGDGCAD